MRPATVTLVLATAPDIRAARQLHDYDGLDDADVCRALEQMRMQRFGALEWPAHLCAITHVGAVIAHEGGVSLLGLAADTDERAMFVRLYDDWPLGEGAIVGWHGGEAALLAARSFILDLRMAAGVSEWPQVALSARLDPLASYSAMADDARESELARLTGRGSHAGIADTRLSVMRQAAARHRWWLRWQSVTGAIGGDERAAGETALAAAEDDALSPA